MRIDASAHHKQVRTGRWSGAPERGIGMRKFGMRTILRPDAERGQRRERAVRARASARLDALAETSMRKFIGCCAFRISMQPIACKCAGDPWLRLILYRSAQPSPCDACINAWCKSIHDSQVLGWLAETSRGDV